MHRKEQKIKSMVDMAHILHRAEKNEKDKTDLLYEKLIEDLQGKPGEKLIRKLKDRKNTVGSFGTKT